ncbi:P-type conjugative transfer protein TrbG [Agrobacterium sp. RAC06]|uniref:P-type conjugative transfer protein TrbG n=1 Tax=Agrobacterium sp. RAC06 TaxID=1842536 RepID=UPI00083D8DB4|nr:P-type conjugative transfer protein TrbG [Agrobacterium sp. RAC06]
MEIVVTYRFQQHATGILISILAFSGAGHRQALSQEMTPAEVKALSHSSAWQGGRGGVTHGRDGKVLFVFADGQASIICAPLQVCDIELQAQETVKDVLVGDSVRWSVEAASSGEGAQQTIHLIVRPTEANLATSMIVTTSMRTYHIRLRSHESRYMARIGFSYPQTASSQIAIVNARLGARGHAASPGRLDFAYRIEGQAKWRPKRVYFDGQKTYIQFPAGIANGEMPVLFLMSEGARQIVNYRVNKDLMIVDHQVDAAVLLSGTGWRQKKITIKRGR